MMLVYLDLLHTKKILCRIKHAFGGLQRQMAEVNKVVDLNKIKVQQGLRRRLQILEETKRELAGGGFVNLIPNDIQTEVKHY